LNAAAARFNSAREAFPAVLFAGLLGFGPAYFDRIAESELGTVDQNPKVAF
jgi:LemA protein